MFPALSLLFVSVAQAAPSGIGQTRDNAIGITGYFEVPVEWDVQAFPNGPVLTLNGTAQEVHSQLRSINPNYDTDFHRKKPEARDLPVSGGTDFSNSTVNCHELRYGKSSIDFVGAGILYLRGLKGKPRNGGGPGTCGRVSCTYDASIWWCNESPYPKTLNSWGSIADGAMRVWSVCAGRAEYGYSPSQMGGQAIHPTDWSVMVQMNKC